MSSYNKRLKKDLDICAAEGLITPEQAAKVYARASSGGLLSGLKAAHIIAIFAGVLISAGVLLLIAHNWDKLGSVAKIAGYLLVFAAAAETAMRFGGKPAAAVPAEILWFFMPVIGIGLYAQIFQLSGDPVKPYLLWAALSLPLALFAGAHRPAFLLVILLFGVLFLGTLSPGNMLSLVARHGQTPAPDWWRWPAALGILGTAAAVSARTRAHPVFRVTGAGLVWLVILLFAGTPLRVHSAALLLLAVSSAAALWIAWTSEEERGASRLPYMAWFWTVYGMTFFWHYKPAYRYAGTDSPWGAGLAWGMFAFALVSAALRPLLKDAARGLEAAFKAALIAPMLASFLLFGASETGAKAIALFANFLICAAGTALIWNGAAENSEKRINYGIAAVSLIVITRFFDIFGSLLKSGVGFIATGMIFAALAYFINRGRKALIQSAGGAK